MKQGLFAELKRRHVYRVAVAYAVVGWLVIQLAATVSPYLHLPDTLTTIVIVVIALGFPVAVILAWAFEMTPDGVRRTEAPDSPAARDSDQHRKVGHTLDRIIIGVLVVAVALLAWRVWSPHGVTPAVLAGAASAKSAAASAPAPATSSVAVKSIAVLPFANLSGDKSQQYFSDGISEDLLNLLARIPQLQVTARTSSFWFRGKNYTIPQIAEKLHVAYILEGSVQKAGDEVRVSVQLVDAASDSQRWSQTYTRRLKDVFKLQDEIGADVVKQLRVQLLGNAPTVKPVDPQAYKYYLQGRLLSYQQTPATIKQSDALYRKALAIDPRYAAAWIGLAQNSINKPWVGNFSWAQGFGQAHSDIKKALAIDPDNAEGLSLEGYLATFESLDFKKAAGHFRKAMTLDPSNPDVLLNVGKFLYVLDRPHQALAVFNRAKRLDPVNPDIDVNMAVVYVQMGDLKRAVATLRKAQSLSPENTQTPYLLAWIELGLGDPKKALADFPDQQEPLPSILCAMGQHAKGMKILNGYLRQVREAKSTPGPSLASMYADCGDPDKAFALLDESVGVRNRAVPYTIYGLSFSKYHDDPRFKAYLRKMGFAPDQLAKVKFEVNLPTQ